MPVVKNYHCPNCGAALPLQRASTGTCEYCNTAYTIEGMQHYQGMLTNEPIKSGVTFCAQPLQVHTMLVNYLLSDVSAPLDFAEKAEITGIRPLCLPAYYFHCNGTSDYLCDVANESTREVSASGNTEVVTGKSWATINGSTHAEAEGIVSGNPEYDNLINSMYNPFESGCLTDPESLEIPANIETVRYSRPATDILSQFARPFLTQKLQESAARQLGNRECRNLTLGSINISQDQGVDKVLVGAYEITCQYGDTVRKVYVSPDGRRMVAAEGPLVEKVLAVNKQITYDTQENRLVKFMLQSTVRRIEDFTRRYQNSTPKADKKIIAGATRMSRELQRLLSNTFLSEVSERNAAKSMSLVFGMAPGYRELYKYYLMLQNGIAVGGDIFHMSVRDTAQLYEYWCFIKLYDILRNRYTLKSPDIIKVDRKGVTVDLVKGKDSNVVFLNPKNGELIKLTYNQSESKTQTVSQRPDNILELEKKGSSVSYKYVFDAKYRIEMDPDPKYYPDDKPGPKVDDINTMHRYRDSIVYANPSSRFTFEKTMFGAYILFPYAREEEYTKHKFYKSIETVNIGGLPFLPSATSLVTELLDELVTDSPEAAFERATLPVGIEERLRLVDWSRRDVLIGLVPDDAHLKLYTDKLMYFTPRFDIGHLPVRYVALYEKGKGISRYGEVVSWRRAARGTLPGGGLSHGAHKRPLKKEPYNVFEVLKWHTLATPISIAEYGPSPIAYTNFFLLSNSSSYSELFLKNEDEYRFFAGLKRMTDKAILENEDEATAFEFDGLKVLLDKKEIYVVNGEKLDKQDSLCEFVKHPNRTFRRLQKYAEKLKGKEITEVTVVL